VNVSIPDVSLPKGDVEVDLNLEKESSSSCSDDKKKKKRGIDLNISGKVKSPKIDKPEIKGELNIPVFDIPPTKTQNIKSIPKIKTNPNRVGIDPSARIRIMYLLHPRNKPLKAAMGTHLTFSHQLPRIQPTTCRRDFCFILFRKHFFYPLITIVLMIGLKKQHPYIQPKVGANKGGTNGFKFSPAALDPLKSGRTEEICMLVFLKYLFFQFENLIR
jgi:hypothetical protein